MPGHGAVALPAVAGRFLLGGDDLADAADDFGHHVHHRPLAVLHPHDVSDVAAAVRFGSVHGVPVVPRGAGHSVDGQAQAPGGVVVDMAALGGVDGVDDGRVEVRGGTRWRAVLDATLPCGEAPPVLTDYLDLTVGGTLSVGGFGGASQRHGSQADNVLELDVVTPAGTRRTCSPVRWPQLFHTVLGGQGRHGVITRAVLATVPVPAAARRHRLTYRELGSYLADQRRLVTDGRFTHVDGQVRRTADGWRFVTEAVLGFDPPDEPDDDALLHGLRVRRDAVETVTDSYPAYLTRFGAVEAHLRSTGSWGFPHPRCNVLIPGRHAEQIVSEVLAGLSPDLLGTDGSVLLYVMPSARIGAPRRLVARDPFTVLLGVQRTAPAGDVGTLLRMTAANLALQQRVIEVGGAGYGPPLTARARAA